MKPMASLALLWLASVMYPFQAQAQEAPADTVSSVVELDEVIIEGIDYRRYALGMNTNQLDLRKASQQSLSEALRTQAGINLVDYGGTGQLSTINLRGLGTSRTSLLWQGMEINSFTLGLIDYSLLPASANNEVTVYKGAGSSLFGNGAIGGTVSLNNAAPLHQPAQLDLMTGIGSYGRRELGLTNSGHHKQWAWQLRASTLSAANNYPYTLADSTVRQQNADVQLHSLNADLHFRGKKGWNSSLHGWYQYNDRDVQPSRTDLISRNHLLNKTLRLLGRFSIDGDALSHAAKMGFTRDWQQYNLDEPILTNRYFSSWESAWSPSGLLDLRAGINWNHLRPQAPAFGGLMIENRNDLYGSVLYKPSSRWQVGSNLRMPMVDGKSQAFSPTLFAQRQLIRKAALSLQLRAQASRNFRLPTLNDRFWNPGGNPDLLPELAHSVESSLRLHYQKAGWSLQGSLSGYYHDVDNWIIWRPGGRGTDEAGNPISFWYPDNVRRVLARGLSLDQQLSRSTGPWALDLALRGNYTRTTNEEVLNALDRSKGKQLPYTPLFQGNATLGAARKGWRIWLQVQHLSKRFTETNNELPPLPAYQLLSTGIDILPAGGKGINCHIAVYNLLDSEYESYQNRAMPGRNYRLSITLPILSVLRKPES